MNARKGLKRAIAHVYARLLHRRVVTDKAFFRLWERRGYHITPVHYYEPLPDTRALRDDLWQRRSELPGIRDTQEQQRRLLGDLTAYKVEYEAFPRTHEAGKLGFYLHNGRYGPVDAEILYGMVRRFQPARIIEIGCGFSTLLALAAITKNREERPGYRCRLTGIDPYPPAWLRGLPGMSDLIESRVQDVPLPTFADLDEDDILFIDSTHVAAVGSDVVYELLEIVPRVKKGVIVQVHDVYFPDEYPREGVMENFMFWNEQYLVQAFLAFNDSFEILLSGSLMNALRPEDLEQAFSSYRRGRTRPASLWIRRTR
jgi:hypothetical protein